MKWIIRTDGCDCPLPGLFNCCVITQHSAFLMRMRRHLQFKRLLYERTPSTFITRGQNRISAKTEVFSSQKHQHSQYIRSYLHGDKTLTETLQRCVKSRWHFEGTLLMHGLSPLNILHDPKTQHLTRYHVWMQRRTLKQLSFKMFFFFF